MSFFIKTLTFGLTADYPPFSFHNGNAFDGMDVVLAHRFANAMQASAKFFVTTWQNMLDDLHRKRFDVAIGGIAVTPFRQQQAIFSTPYLTGGKTPVGKQSDTGRFRTLSDIDKPNVSVLTNEGGTNEAFVDKYIKQARVKKVPTNHGIFDILSRGDSDVMFTDSTEASYIEHVNPKLTRLMPNIVLNKFELAFMVSLNEHSLIHQINAVLHQCIEEGTLEELKQCYHLA